MYVGFDLRMRRARAPRMDERNGTRNMEHGRRIHRFIDIKGGGGGRCYYLVGTANVLVPQYLEGEKTITRRKLTGIDPLMSPCTKPEEHTAAAVPARRWKGTPRGGVPPASASPCGSAAGPTRRAPAAGPHAKESDHTHTQARTHTRARTANALIDRRIIMHSTARARAKHPCDVTCAISHTHTLGGPARLRGSGNSNG